MQSPNVQFYGDSEWKGLDLYNAPQNIPPGFCTQADALFVQAGRWFIRPGFQGQLATALGNPIYAPTPVIQSDGSVHIWFGCNGNVYKFIPDGAHTTVTQVTYGGMPSLVMDNADHTSGLSIASEEGYVYIADGTANPMMRFAADGSGGTAAIGLNQPSPISPVTLGHRELFATPGALTWSSYESYKPYDVNNLQNLITTPVPTAANCDASGTKYWTASAIGAHPTGVYFGTFHDTGAVCTGIGGPANSGTVGSGANIKTTNAIALSPGTDGAYPAVFLCQFNLETYYFTASAPPSSRVLVTLFLYSDSGSTLIETRSFHVGLGSFVTTLQSVTFDCRDVSSPIHSVRLMIEDDNSGLAGDDPQVSNIALYCGGYKFYAPTTTDILTIYSGTVFPSPVGNACTSGTDATTVAVPQPTQFYSRNHVIYTGFSSTNYSGYQRITANAYFNFPVDTGVTVPVRLYIENGSGTRFYGAETDLSLNTLTVIDFDLTTAPTAVVTAVTKLGIQFLADIPIPASYVSNTQNPTANGGNYLLGVIDFTDPGNLSVDDSITYKLVEINSNSDTTLINIIQSNGSNNSVAIVPTITDATATLTLPAKTNSSSDYFAIYRFGDFSDGLGRLLCMEQWSTSTFAYGADTRKPGSGTVVAPANPYISLTNSAGTITILDNTPSSWLFANTYTSTYIDGRISPPLYIRDIVGWQHRLWLIAGQGRNSTLWGSWLIPSDQQAGLYFSTSVSPTDPYAAIKGFSTPIGTKQNDISMRMIPVEDRAAILNQRKPPYVLTGSDGTNFALSDYPLNGGESLGLVGRNAVVIAGNLVTKSVFVQPSPAVVYLTVNGLMAWDTYRLPRDLTIGVRMAIAPQLMNLPAFKTDAVAQASVWRHGDWIYLTMPGSTSDTYPTVVWRYREAENPQGEVGGGQSNGAWSRWPSLNMMSGTSVPNSGDNTQSFVMGRDGQIYLLVAGDGDKALSSSTAVVIPFAFTTRYFGFDAPFNVKHANWIDWDFEYQSSEPDVTLTLGATSRQAIWTQSYTLQEGGGFSSNGNNIDHVSLRPGFTAGEVIAVTVSGSTKNILVIGPVGPSAAIGSRRKR